MTACQAAGSALKEGEARYSPAEIASTEVVPVIGRPDPNRICTSIVERSNLSLRMGIRRFTRLTTAFSKMGEPLGSGCPVVYLLQLLPSASQLARDACYAAGIADHVWTVKELLA